ncbi:hypothetical protein FB106_1234 [Synechococcus sp. Ace-Pa]|nr:hypothetical protein FB106_1234 [Synechococcus sp. Ace-Pa]
MHYPFFSLPVDLYVPVEAAVFPNGLIHPL